MTQPIYETISIPTFQQYVDVQRCRHANWKYFVCIDSEGPPFILRGRPINIDMAPKPVFGRRRHHRVSRRFSMRFSANRSTALTYTMHVYTVDDVGRRDRRSSTRMRTRAVCNRGRADRVFSGLHSITRHGQVLQLVVLIIGCCRRHDERGRVSTIADVFRLAIVRWKDHGSRVGLDRRRVLVFDSEQSD